MRSFTEISANYRFSEEEAELLRSLWPVVEPRADALAAEFYEMLKSMPDAAKFLQDPERLARLRRSHQEWLKSLFLGPFDESYFERLKRVGKTHVRINLSAHFVYVAMNFVRQYLKGILARELEPDRLEEAQRAVDKVLDLNLDIMARTYHEAEMNRVFLSYQLDDLLIRFARRFTFGLNLLLLVGLVALAGGIVVVLLHDVSLIFRGSMEKGLVAALGSLLILWLAIELLDAEIDRLRGGELQLSLFVGVALVAFIRKVLIATLSHEDLRVEAMYLAGILILGVIYWLVARTEAHKRKEGG